MNKISGNLKPKRLAIIQSNYIPWKGYFDLMASVDEFILFDEVQYTKRDWRNRNIIKTPNGLKWLTVPVKVKGKFLQKISETVIDGDKWRQDHVKSIETNYKSAPFFSLFNSEFRELYDQPLSLLSDLNYVFLDKIRQYLHIQSIITRSSDYEIIPGKSERLLSLCLQSSSNVYVSGPSARSYLDETLFLDHGVRVEWFEYSGYPEYPQLWGGFSHYVSILDLLLNMGPSSRDYMKLHAS